MTLPVAGLGEPAPVERARRRLSQLHVLTTTLGGARTTEQVATAIIDCVPPALGATAAVIGILDADGTTLHTVRVSGFAPDALAEEMTCPIDSGFMLADAARTGALIALPSRAERLARYPAHAALGAPGGDGAAVAVAMRLHGHVIGAIGLSFPHDQPFDADDRAFIEIVAGQCALAWERAREDGAARHELAERRRAEDALRASEARLGAALSAAQMGAFTIDLATGRVDASAETGRLFGLHRDGSHVIAAYLEAVHPEDRPRLMAALGRAEGNEERTLEFRVQLPDGGERILLAQGARVHDAAGQIQQVTGAVMDITSRRRMEAELERTAGQLRTVLDHLPVAVWLTDAAGSILLDNPAGVRIWGRRFTEQGHAGAARAWLPDTGRQIGAGEWSLDRALRDGAATPEEVIEIERADGERRTILSSCVPVLGAAGEILGAVVMNEDVTERQRAERQARLQATALADAGDAVIAVDTDDRVTYWNSGAERLYGLPATTMVGRPLELSHRPLWPAPEAEAEALATLAHSGRWLGEATHLTHDGRELPVEVSLTAVRDPQGSPAGRLAVVRDLTARRRMEAELQASDERLRLALLATPVTLYAQDRDLRYTFMFNPAPGFAPDFAIGRRDEDFMAPQYAAQLTALKQRVLDSGQPLREQIETDAGGEVIAFDLMIEPRRDTTGAVTGITGVAVDITARRRAELERDALLAGISHDLKNPLAVIRGVAQLALRTATRATAPDVQALTAPLDGIIDAARRIDVMLDDFLDIARTQSGRPLELDRVTLDLAALMQRATEEVAQQRHAHAFALTRAPGDLTGTWDAVRLERVAANLLANATKFSPEGSLIQVRLWREGGSACFSVQDEGRGIPAADLPRIFEPFFRAANATGQVAGSGLGLSTARQIIEQHGGTITVESTEGAGTTVTVRLPLAAP